MIQSFMLEKLFEKEIFIKLMPTIFGLAVGQIVFLIGILMYLFIRKFSICDRYKECKTNSNWETKTTCQINQNCSEEAKCETKSNNNGSKMVALFFIEALSVIVFNLKFPASEFSTIYKTICDDISASIYMKLSFYFCFFLGSLVFLMIDLFLIESIIRIIKNNKSYGFSPSFSKDFVFDAKQLLPPILTSILAFLLFFLDLPETFLPVFFVVGSVFIEMIYLRNKAHESIDVKNIPLYLFLFAFLVQQISHPSISDLQQVVSFWFFVIFVFVTSFYRPIPLLKKTILIKQNENSFPLVYKTEGSAGADIRSNIDKVIEPKETCKIPTGIFIEMPEGIECQIRSRSGLALKGIIVLNGVGTIDSDYRGELMVLLYNLSDENFEIKKGDRIAQLIFADFQSVEFETKLEISNTKRGQGGFGSTGL